MVFPLIPSTLAHSFVFTGQGCGLHLTTRALQSHHNHIYIYIYIGCRKTDSLQDTNQLSNLSLDATIRYYIQLSMRGDDSAMIWRRFGHDFCTILAFSARLTMICIPFPDVLSLRLRTEDSHPEITPEHV